MWLNLAAANTVCWCIQIILRRNNADFIMGTCQNVPRRLPMQYEEAARIAAMHSLMACRRQVHITAPGNSYNCAMRASYNGNTLASQARADGSIPFARSK